MTLFGFAVLQCITLMTFAAAHACRNPSVSPCLAAADQGLVEGFKLAT
jgi:hypothetical protein